MNYDHTISLYKLPNPSISHLILSPDFKNSGGLYPIPTPSGVPVLIISPGSKQGSWLRQIAHGDSPLTQ